MILSHEFDEWVGGTRPHTPSSFCRPLGLPNRFRGPRIGLGTVPGKVVVFVFETCYLINSINNNVLEDVMIKKINKAVATNYYYDQADEKDWKINKLNVHKTHGEAYAKDSKRCEASPLQIR